jgi:glycosyltransferase involved in cell wall biosynthesis
VVLNVPDDAKFLDESHPVAADGNHFRLVVVSTLIKRYGVQTTIKAIPLLLKAIPELKVDVVGRGEYRPELEKLARDLGVEEYLNFTGFVDHDEVASYIARAHVGLAPMIDDVGVSNKLFEYFAMGTPTVASALPSLTATFSDDCVLYYRPGDEKELADRVLELYHSPEKRASMIAQAQKFYRNCQWQVMKHEYLKVYEKCLRP